MSIRRSRSRPLCLVAITLAAVAVLLALGACGSGSATTPSSPSTDTPSTGALAPPTPTTEPTPADSPVPAESNPPGDIPDNIAFIRYANTSGRYSFTHPEGWAQTGRGSQVQFTDKLNGVRANSETAKQPPTVANAKADEVARLQASVAAFELRDVTQAKVPAGASVRIVFRRNSDPDPVTGKVYRDEVEEYLVYSKGRLVKMELFGPVGADNVDAYRTMTQSLEIR